jgi:PAS domain S-box-containing protein
MSAISFENPGLSRSVLEDLPIGAYIVDRERRVRFWNRMAEEVTGHLAHEAMGQDGTGHLLDACDHKGNALSGETCPVTLTLTNGRPQQFEAYFLHKKGHRVKVRVLTRAIVEHGDQIVGATVVFEEQDASSESTGGHLMYGCLDEVTGVPSPLLTRAVLTECVAEMGRSRRGFGVLRVHVLGLKEFSAKHGMQSAVPFLREAAYTLRHSLSSEHFVGRWGDDEFIAVLPSANPVATRGVAETMWNLLRHSEVSWWGDQFPVQAVVTHAVAEPGDTIEKLLHGLESGPAEVKGHAFGATIGS